MSIGHDDPRVADDDTRATGETHLVTEQRMSGDGEERWLYVMQYGIRSEYEVQRSDNMSDHSHNIQHVLTMKHVNLQWTQLTSYPLC